MPGVSFLGNAVNPASFDNGDKTGLKVIGSFSHNEKLLYSLKTNGTDRQTD